MRFQAHFLGGVTAGSAALWIGNQMQLFSFSSENFFFWISSSFQGMNVMHFSDIRQAITGFCITLLMSLFPDIDTSSIPQRWFFRCLFVILIVFLLTKNSFLFTLFSFVGFMPLLQRHRSWTHSLWTPWLLSLGIFLGYEIFHLPPKHLTWNSLQIILSFISALTEKKQLFFIFCAVLGHYTHLFLDSNFLRKITPKCFRS